MLQGIFGWGLKRNILSLYLFLCRNYRQGDRICLFGFSRGAFTVRVLADLIDKQGIIPHHHGDALAYLVADAYRDYRRGQRPRMCADALAGSALQMARDGFDPTAGARSASSSNIADANDAPASIDFVGVWDTVSAYGGPIVELVRAVDDWIMPISFTDKRLPGCVKAARHALALDDERDSFQPLPWDEKRRAAASRLEQVWFAGMHSDVGGGYPDDSLSYVSFNWMVDEAQDMRRDSLSQGPRQGGAGAGRQLRSDPRFPRRLGGYYRYQPRRISALMWPVDQGGRYLVDPEQWPRPGHAAADQGP